MRNFLGAGKRRQGAGAGSAYVASSFAVSGVVTYAFFVLSERFLGRAGFGDLGILWSAVFLTVQVLYIGITQTLGRYVAEREARNRDWRPVVVSVRRVQVSLLAAFLLASLFASPLLARGLFDGDWPLTAAFLAAVAAYAPEYFRRGIFGGHRQFARLGALHVAESSSRALMAAALLFAGAGVLGPVVAVVLAPLVGVLAVRPTPATPPEKEGEPFSAAEAFRFAGPVLASVAFAQALMNGGPILVSLFGGSDAQAGLLFAALILARAPQYVLSPAIAGLLPQASRILATDGAGGLDRFVGKAVAVVGFVGAAMVAGTWLLGEWAMRLVYENFEASRGVLVMLALLAASYLTSETLNQGLFARGSGRLAALGWLTGLLASAVCLAVLETDILHRVSYSLALGALAAALAQAAFYLLVRRRPG